MWGKPDLGEKVRYLVVLLAVLALALPAQGAASVPHAPAWFVRQALCVHHYEAGAWRWTPYYHPGYTYWNQYWTGLQFTLSTWDTSNRYLGRRDSPWTGSSRIVILHAYAIVRHDGSWREWPNTAKACGLL